MKISTSALALALGSASRALFIDPSLPDGLYVAHANASDPDQHIRRWEPRRRRPTPTAYITKRSPSSNLSDISTRIRFQKHRILREALLIATGRRFCRVGRTFNTSDYHDAINLLFETPLFWVSVRNTRFALSGGAVYVCALSGWNTASMVEFMSAMALLDADCGPNTAGKLSLRDWAKFYGRETRRNNICQAESGKGSIKNELVEVVAAGCQRYVGGINRWLGHRGTCNDNAYGSVVWQKLKAIFPWYKTPAETVEEAGQEHKII